MIDDNLLIAVLMGGPGTERDVSLASGNAVVEALKSEGLNAVPVEVTGRELSLPEGTGLCFNCIHGTFGEDGELQEMLDNAGIPYTGAGAGSSRLAFDKVASKMIFSTADVPTPLSEIINCAEATSLSGLSLPYVVKPPREGSSVGVHLVKNEADAMAAMEDAAKYGAEVLVEQYIPGKELTVGIIDGEVLPIIHIAPEGGFYDTSNKYPWLANKGSTEYRCPADLDEETTVEVQKAALDAYNTLGIEVYARVDILLDDRNHPYVLEINTIPGMTETSLLPKAAKEAGYEFGPLCKKIAELSLALRG